MLGGSCVWSLSAIFCLWSEGRVTLAGCGPQRGPRAQDAPEDARARARARAEVCPCQLR